MTTVKASLIESLTKAAKDAGLEVLSHSTGANSMGYATTIFKLALPADKSKTLQLELSEHFDFDKPNLLPELTAHLATEAKRTGVVIVEIEGSTAVASLPGEGFVADGTSEGRYLDTSFQAWKLRSSKPGTQQYLEVVTHVAQTETLALWQEALDSLAKSAEPSLADARQKSQEPVQIPGVAQTGQVSHRFGE